MSLNFHKGGPREIFVKNIQMKNPQKEGGGVLQGGGVL